MNDKEKIIERIKKLLALTKSPNEHEAARATERVQEMLVKHNISMQQVATEEAKTSIEQDAIKTKARVWQRIIRGGCAHLYFCHYYYSESKEYVTRRATAIRYDYHFYVGEPHNIIVAQLMSEYLVETVQRLARHGALMFPKKERNRYRRSFWNTCARRLRQRIEQRIFDTKTKTVKTSDGKNLPALASLYNQAKELTDKFLEENVEDLETVKYNTRSSHIIGRIEGEIAGNSISLDQQVGGKGGAEHLLENK